MYKVFLSHSSKDVVLLESFLNLLIRGMNLREDEIFCTSIKGTLPTGESFINAIQENIRECEAVIFLITESYMKSPFCLAELGAAWALGQTIFPLIVPPLTHENVEETPLSGRQCLKLFERTDIEQLGTDFLSKGISKFNLSKFREFVDLFLSQNISMPMHTALHPEALSNQAIQKYIEVLTEQARTDDKARFLLGTIYWEGILTKQDKKQAKELLTEAAYHNYAPAQYKLSSMYYKGETGEQSFEKAFEWEQRAAADENPIVLDSLAFLYRCGLGCEKDLDKALECYNKAAEHGCKSSYSCAADIYLLQGDYAQAAEYYSKSVESGYKQAAYDLGMLYKEGRKGFQTDYMQAAYYFEIAAQAGITEAKYQLGQLYYMGYAVFQRDFNAAVKWFKEAAEEGDVLSQYNLGYAYHHGLGVEYNWDLAAHWYEQAAKRGHQLSQVDLADLCAQADRREYQRAIYWYEKAAKQNSSDAHRKLGDMYFFGLGGEVDQIKAINHYRAAIEQQELVAEFRLEYGTKAKR